MTTSLHRLTLALLVAFASLALTSGYWIVGQRGELLSRNENPRNLIAEARIRRGAILDRHGTALASTSGEPGDYVRAYSLLEAAPVVGYASLRYGVAGVEAAESAVLRGEAGRSTLEVEWQTGLLGAPQLGRDVRLTLDAGLQRAAAAALGGDVGAVVVLNVTTGEVLAMVSSPAFDPNSLDADWERLIADTHRAPLLNRATLGSYQPGGALQPIIFAGALERGLAAPDAVFVAGAPLPQIEWRGATLGCDVNPDRVLTLAEAFAWACPSPFAELGTQLKVSELTQLLADFGLYDAPELGLPSAASPRTPVPATLAERRLAAAGLGDLRVSPLQMALVAAAFANHGILPPLQLVAAAQDAAGQWTIRSPLDHPRSAIGASSADAVAVLFLSDAGSRATNATRGQAHAVGHASLALTGPAAQPIAWYLGFAPALSGAPRFAIAVLIEGATIQRAAEVGQTILGAASPE